MILDTSALMAVLRDEREASRFEALIATEKNRISAGTLLEVQIVAAQRGVSAELSELLDLAAPEVVAFDEAQAALASAAFEQFGKGRHPAGLNLGDCFAYALARALDEPLLFKGDDFSKTDVKVAVRLHRT